MMGIKKWAIKTFIHRALKRGMKRLRRELGPDRSAEMLSWLDGKKTYITAVMGALAVIAGALFGPEIEQGLQEGITAVESPGWADDVKWLAAFLSAIFLRRGIMKGPK